MWMWMWISDWDRKFESWRVLLRKARLQMMRWESREAWCISG
jgi:hypothetical protein